MRRECRERFPRHRLHRKPLVSDPGMHLGTCVTHVPWYMPGSLTHGGKENVLGIPGTCATRKFTYLARGPWHGDSHTIAFCTNESTLISMGNYIARNSHNPKCYQNTTKRIRNFRVRCFIFFHENLVCFLYNYWLNIHTILCYITIVWVAPISVVSRHYIWGVQIIWYIIARRLCPLFGTLHQIISIIFQTCRKSGILCRMRDED